VFGNRHQDTPWWQEATIDRKVNLYTEKSFFVKNGAFIGRIALFLFLILTAYTIYIGYSRKVIGASINTKE
jgi:hypothetical protein